MMPRTPDDKPNSDKPGPEEGKSQSENKQDNPSETSDKSSTGSRESDGR